LRARSISTLQVLVDFCTDWCGPCKLVEPLLRELHAGGSCTVVKAKPDECAAWREWLAEQGAHLQVAALPTCIMFEKGRPMRTLVGRCAPSGMPRLVRAAPRHPPVWLTSCERALASPARRFTREKLATFVGTVTPTRGVLPSGA
jgi:hypothetical protein